MPDDQVPLEAALDQLYAADAGEFVPVRKQLTSDLRAAAWALNQLVRRNAQIVDDLLERSRELRVAQTGPAAGDREALRDAIRTHREALDTATDAALAVLGARANDTFRSEIVSTLPGAVLKLTAGEELRLGRIVREVAPSSGFPEVTGLTLVPSSPDPEAATRRKATKRESARDLVATYHEARVRTTAAARHKADLALRDAALERAADAEVEVTKGAAKVEQLEAALDDARRELRAARALQKKAREEATRLSARADRSPG